MYAKVRELHDKNQMLKGEISELEKAFNEQFYNRYFNLEIAMRRVHQQMQDQIMYNKLA